MPFATEVLTISITPVALTSTIYRPAGPAATMAQVTIEQGDIRYYEVGTPSATDGHYLAATPPQTFFICGLDSIQAFKAIRAGTTNARATITYYRSKSP